MYKPPASNCYVPAILYWFTAVCLGFAVLFSFTGNIRGEFYEHWLSMPLSAAVLVTHASRTLLALPLYLIYTVVIWERIMISIYASQSSVFLLPIPILIGLMLILWATGQYRPLRKRLVSDAPE